MTILNMKNNNHLILIILSFIVIGLNIASIMYNFDLLSNTLEKEEAEQIAIETAISEGYTNPQLFTKYGMETTKVNQYSIKEDKDVTTWMVVLFTEDREQVEGYLGDLYYFININNGEIVHKISALKK